MKASKILCPTDFSEFSEAALAQATALARDANATLLIVHVKEPPDLYVDTGLGGYPVDVREADMLKELTEVKPTDPDVGYAQKLLTGDTAGEIVQFVETEDVDMIVMGTHGRRGITRMLMGSVAEAVPCPVLTIKQPAKETAEVNSLLGVREAYSDGDKQ